MRKSVLVSAAVISSLALPLADCSKPTETAGATKNEQAKGSTPGPTSPGVTDLSVHEDGQAKRGISEEGGMKASGPSQGKGGESR